MRVDQNWEDTIGKRLHDFEGDLSPQAWENINKRIKPRRNKRYFWLPALLFFLALPGALYFSGFPSFQPEPDQKLAQNANVSASEKATSASSLSGKIKTENSASPQQQAERPDENGMDSGQKTQGSTNLLVGNAANTHANNEVSLTGKPSNSGILISGIISASKPEKPVTPEKPAKDSKNKNKEDETETSQYFKAKAASQHAGNLAFNQNQKPDQETENSSFARTTLEKTVGFSAEKLTITQAEETQNSINEPAITGIPNVGIAGKTRSGKMEIAAIDPLISEILKANNLLETLPDTIKNQLVVALPEPAELTAKAAKKKTENPENAWEFTVYGTPHYTFQRVLPNTHDNLSIMKLENKNAFETERLGYEFGLRAYYQVRNNLQLCFGFQAARVNQHLRLTTVKMQPDSVVIVQQNNAVKMQLYNSSHQEEHLFQHYFGGIFTGLNLAVANKLDLSGGLGLNWLLQTKSAHESATPATTTFNPYLSLGLQYKLPVSEKLTFKAGPTMQYYLMPVQQKQAFIGVKPTVLGISVGLHFKP